MSRFLSILAKTISALFYPLWIPTYGIFLFCYGIHNSFDLPIQLWLTMVGGTWMITAFVPILLILLDIHSGHIDDIYITNRKQRNSAYFTSMICFITWWYALRHLLHATPWLCGIALGSAIAIGLVYLINHWWKISAHLTSMGGFVGGVFTFQLAMGQVHLSLLISLLALTLAVMYARLYLDAHTSWQVIAGFALGLVCTTVTPLLVYV